MSSIDELNHRVELALIWGKQIECYVNENAQKRDRKFYDLARCSLDCSAIVRRLFHCLCKAST